MLYSLVKLLHSRIRPGVAARLDISYSGLIPGSQLYPSVPHNLFIRIYGYTGEWELFKINPFKINPFWLTILRFVSARCRLPF